MANAIYYTIILQLIINYCNILLHYFLYSQVPDYECDKPEGIHTGFHKILAALNKLTLDYDVDIANRLYAADNIVFKQVTFINGSLY